MESNLESVKESIIDRVGNPVVVAYLLSFIAYNWRVWVILFSNNEDKSAADILTEIDTYLQCFNYFGYLTVPLAFALIYLLLVPVLTSLYTTLIIIPSKEPILQSELALDDKRAVSMEVYKELMKQFEEREEGHKEAVEKLLDQVKFNTPKEQIAGFSYAEGVQKVLERNNHCSESELYKIYKNTVGDIKTGTMKSALDYMKSYGLVSSTEDQGTVQYSLTVKGAEWQTSGKY